MNAKRSTKIVATLGPATSSPERLAELVAAGIDVVRLNFSHGTADDHQKRVGMLREAAQNAGRTVGVMADLLPERMVAESLAQALEELDLEGKPVLVARAAQAREVLPDALRRRGAKLDVVTLYETVAEAPDPEAVERAREADYITFTSASTVRNLVGALGGDLPGQARIVSIGPITSEAAREAGLEVAVEAERHDVDGLVEALLRDAAGG